MILLYSIGVLKFYQSNYVDAARKSAGLLDFLHAGGKAAKVLETFFSWNNIKKKNEKRSRRDTPNLCIYVVP